ncbi:MAG: glycoside hydrolase family 26 protein [Ilumatobacter sp.]
MAATYAREMTRGGRNRVGTLATSLAVAAALAAGCSESERPPVETLGFRAGGGLFKEPAFLEAEEWLDREIRYTVQFTGRQSQQDMNGAAFGLLVGEKSTINAYADRLELSLTVPLGFGNANARTQEGRTEIRSNLELVTSGEFDAAYRRVAERLVEAGFPDAVLRLGHEFNGAWAPWSSRTNEEEFIAAWRHVHEIMSAESPDFRFDWTAIRASWAEWGPSAYPGDDYVDVIGLDIYWRVTPADDDSWDTEVWRLQYQRVLEEHLAFAEAHGKPVSYPEWGLGGGDVPQFVEAMHEWLSDLPTEGPGRLLYHAYFDGNRQYDLDQYPASRARYRELFGDT